MNYDAIKGNLSTQDIVRIIQYFYPSIDFIDKGDVIVFPTICHNLDDKIASKKLYYYDNTHLFKCYTECNDYFDVYQLLQKMLKLRNLPDDFNSIFHIITSQVDVIIDKIQNLKQYQSIADRYNVKNFQPQFKEYDKKVLDNYASLYPQIWIEEGISISSMKKFGIKINIPKEQIVIPHKDIDGKLIGIRVRNLNPLSVENGAKYMPAKINNIYYTHPLMYNLYGIYENRENIKKYKMAWILEGEKSVLKCDRWYPNSCAVASCGDKVNKFQINLLLKLGVRDITICYDRMNDNYSEDVEYYNRLVKMCKKYSKYVNLYFIFDKQHILNYKDAPVDSGKDTFEKLLKERIYVN